MKSIAYTLVLASLVSSAAPVNAKTASGKIAVSAQIVPGNTVSVSLNGGVVTTSVRAAGYQTQGPTPGEPSLLQVTFDLAPSWYFVKRVTWDKPRKHLTIDF